VHSRGWVKAGELNTGDRVDRLDGGLLIVRKTESDTQLHDTYNFEVADLHSYFGAAALPIPCSRIEHRLRLVELVI
jgi:hypothetical protein